MARQIIVIIMFLFFVAVLLGYGTKSGGDDSHGKPPSKPGAH